jgi:hypothetical protein
MKLTDVISGTDLAKRERTINNYIEAYNEFDIDKMVSDFDSNIVFENIQSGNTNMLINGLITFRQQAEEAKTYFVTRKQTIKSYSHLENRTEIAIEYCAVLAMDLPNGLKKGQELNLSGKSIFEFDGDKIIKLTDISL